MGPPSAGAAEKVLLEDGRIPQRQKRSGVGGACIRRARIGDASIPGSRIRSARVCGMDDSGVGGAAVCRGHEDVPKAAIAGARLTAPVKATALAGKRKGRFSRAPASA